MRASRTSRYHWTAVENRGAIAAYAACVISLCSVGLAALRTPSASGPTYDDVLLHAINAGFAHLPLLGFQRILFQADLAEVVLVAGVVALWNSRHIGTLENDALRRRVVLTMAAFIPTYAISRILQHLGHRPRPIGSVSLVPLADPNSWSALQQGLSHWGSFPSDHAGLLTIAAVIAFSLAWRLGLIVTAFGTYVCLYRVAFGFHWPSDILAGVLIGTLVACAALLSEPLLIKRFDRVLAAFGDHPATANTLAVIFLGEFAVGFARLARLLSELGHGRLFH